MGTEHVSQWTRVSGELRDGYGDGVHIPGGSTLLWVYGACQAVVISEAQSP